MWHYDGYKTSSLLTTLLCGATPWRDSNPRLTFDPDDRRHLVKKYDQKLFFVQLEVEERRQRRFVDNFDDGEDDDRRVDILFSTPTPMKPLFDKTCSRHTFGHPGLG